MGRSEGGRTGKRGESWRPGGKGGCPPLVRYQSTVETKTHARIASQGLATWGAVEGPAPSYLGPAQRLSIPPLHWAGQTAGVTPRGGARGLWACALEASAPPTPRALAHATCSRVEASRLPSGAIFPRAGRPTSLSSPCRKERGQEKNRRLGVWATSLG